MGNNIGIGGNNNNNKAAKVMKINGEFFKLKTPSKVIDIIKDYPDHILLDSEEFLRFNLRAKPLDLEFQLKPKKIYLLFQPPRFPRTKGNNNNNNVNNNNNNNSPLPRVNSSSTTTTPTFSNELRMLMTKRSVSDLSVFTKSTDANGTSDSDDNGAGDTPPVVGPTRVKLKLPKAQVKKIMEESIDDAEVAERIIHLSTTVDGSSTVVDVTPAVKERDNVVPVTDVVKVVDNRRCFNVHGMCGLNYQRKYKKLSN